MLKQLPKNTTPWPGRTIEWDKWLARETAAQFGTGVLEKRDDIGNRHAFVLSVAVEVERGY
jgi:hypothetical protein